MKRIISVLLAACLALSMGITAFAAATTYTKFYQNSSLQEGYNRYYNLMGTTKEIKGQMVDVGNIRPNDNKVIYIGLYNTMFADKNGAQGGAGGAATPALLTQADLRASKFTVYTRYMSGSQAIKKISLDSKNSRIKVEFADEYVSTKDLDFEVLFYLAINGVRMTDRGFTVTGTLTHNEVPVYSDFESVDISDQSVAVANESVRNLSVEIGHDVEIIANLSRNQKYYGTASSKLTADDQDVFAKYRNIVDVINIKTVGLNRTGNTVRLGSEWAGLYVYDANLNYLGRSNAKLPFHTKYYLADKQLRTSSSSGNSGSSSSGSNSSGSISTQKPPVEIGGELTKADVTSLFNSALRAKPANQKTLSIKVQNKTSISLDALKELQRLANNAKVTSTLVVDSVSDGSVKTRLNITPANATKSIDTRVLLNSTDASNVASYFKKWYKNSLFVIDCRQESSFGMTVKIVAKLPNNFKTNNLVFYSYDRAANSYQRITSPNYTVDSAGYVYFNTSMADYIIVSNGVLTK